MSYKSEFVRKICFYMGIVFILLALITLIVWQIFVNNNAEKLSYYADTLYEIIPTPYSAVVEERSNNVMPSLSIDGRDFIVLLEFFGYDSVFPVGAVWEDSFRYPCRYTGSIYDNSLIIGGTNQKGQFTFVKEISVGDRIFLTDMTGAKYSYTVADIKYSAAADNEILLDNNNDFTIFVKNMYAFEYIIIRCNSTGKLSG